MPDVVGNPQVTTFTVPIAAGSDVVNESNYETFTFNIPAGCYNANGTLDILGTTNVIFTGSSIIWSLDSLDGIGNLMTDYPPNSRFYTGVSAQWEGTVTIAAALINAHQGGTISVRVRVTAQTSSATATSWQGITSSVILHLTNPSSSYMISPSSAHYGVGGGTGTITVSASTLCPWTAVSNATWIHILSGASGTGSGTVSYSVDPNYMSGTRTGTITAGGKTFTVTQDCCTFSVNPSSLSVSGNGEKVSVLVTPVNTNCVWTASADLPFDQPPDDASWLRILPGSSYIQFGDGTDNAVAFFNGTGTSSFFVQVLPNASDGAVPRTANLIVQSGCQLTRIAVMQGAGSTGGGGPGAKTPGGNPWCLHDRYGRFHVATAGDGGILYFRSDGATPLPDAMNPNVTNGWELSGSLVASGGVNPRMTMDFRDRLHLIAETGGASLLYSVSDDDGATWSSADVSIPNALKPTIASGHDGTMIIAAYVPDDPDNPDDGGSIQATIQGPGDAMPSTVFPFLDQDGSVIPAANDTFHLSNAFEGPNRWVLAMRQSADADTSIWYTAQDVQAEDGTVTMQWAQISGGN